MAGKLKHMARSHRSYRSNGSEFIQFHRHAYNVMIAKEDRKPATQRLSSVLRRMIPTKKEA